jgi:8-oxo-dGTP pyrophosphatase MutT (NUDIX family)
VSKANTVSVPERKKKAQVWIWRRGTTPSRDPGTPRQQVCILVLLLKTNPDRGGFWQPVTGHVEPGESFAQGALREAREETALSFAGPPIPLGYCFEFEGRWGPAVEEAFALEIGSPMVSGTDFGAGPVGAENPPPRLDPSEHCDFRWCPIPEAAHLLSFDSNREALARLSALLSFTHSDAG